MAGTLVRESIREIDGDSWLIGGKLLLTRAPPSESPWHFRITDASPPLPASRPLSGAGAVRLIHDVGDVSAVFRLGDAALCKVKVVDVPRATREHTTLAWLHARPWSFAIPTVRYHAEFDGRYYVVMDRVPGSTLDSLWPTLEEAERQRLVEQIVSACAELAVPAPGESISGVDGCFLPEKYLCGRDLDCSPENLRKTSLTLGMDCSTLVFYHCDLGPTNILVDQKSNRLGLIDWEIAGFVPMEWIRTKFRVSSGLDLSSGDPVDWRKRVMLHMGELGYPDVAAAFSEVMLSGSRTTK